MIATVLFTGENFGFVSRKACKPNISSSTSKRSRGRPKREVWRRTVEGKRQKMGFANWNEAVAAARDRADWRREGNDSILQEES